MGTHDDEVVTRLIAERSRALTGYAYLLCGNVHDAEDLVQDALVKTFARRRSGIELDSAEAYVRRAVLTLYLDGWRKRKRWSVRLPVAAEPTERADHADAVGDRVDVVAALAELPRQQRACVVLRYYEDRTVAEIADALGVGDGTVKRYLSLATRRLESLLGPLPTDDHDELVHTTTVEVRTTTGRAGAAGARTLTQVRTVTRTVDGAQVQTTVHVQTAAPTEPAAAVDPTEQRPAQVLRIARER